MPVRDRIADGLTRLAKVFGNAEPAAFAQGEAAAGMDTATAFSPGKPPLPYDGYSRTPRAHEFTPQYNVAARPRSHERIAFSTLRGLIDSYDIAQICIWHRIDSVRSLERSLVAADGYAGDVTDAVKLGWAALKKPDRKTPFDAWLAEYLYDVLAYDAGTLSRMRDRLGRAVGLRVVDGTTIAPLLDNWGDPPSYPAESHVQYVNGLPWNWLTERDLVYQPFRKKPDSPYGHAPMESLLLNANTDLRFQAYFLQRFTEGNIPRAFASAPETWTPDQIEQFQQNWDALMRGDQEIQSQIKWIPGGGKIAWSDEKDFSDTFSLFMMRKTAAGYHVVPADLGFTETVNKSAGETQSDVQHRLGDTPLAKHMDGILTGFLQDDLGLPIQHKFDLGEEQDDRLATAQSDFIYWRMGSVGTSEIREMRFGLSEPEGRPVPRTFFTERAGPIPISALESVAGPVDQLTGAPAAGALPPGREFTPVEGTLPNPAPDTPPLAEQIYGPSAIAGIPQPTVAKDGSAPAGPAAGITAATGIYGYDLVGHDDGEEDEEQSPLFVAKAAEVRAAELGAFRAYVRKSRRTGRAWRDFEFRAHRPLEAHRLNDSGRLLVRKASGQVAVAGLAALAADTGRVLMLQRALNPRTCPCGMPLAWGMDGGDWWSHADGSISHDAPFHPASVSDLVGTQPPDPAAGTWEFPGGHLEGDETPLAGAAREWAEETGCMPPAGHQSGTWLSPDGIYQGIVWTIPAEAQVPVFEDRDQVTNPDDPDGDRIEALAWWDPAQLPGNPAVRPELLASIDTVMAALGRELAKAGAGGGSGPKAPPPAEGEPVAQAWPGWQLDLAAAAYWAPLIAAALTGAISPKSLALAYLADHPGVAQAEGETKPEMVKRLTAEAQQWVQTERDAVEQALEEVLDGAYTDGYLIGATSAQAVVEAIEAEIPLTEAVADVGAWVVGDTEAAQLLLGELGDGAGLRALLDEFQITIKSVASSRLDELGRALAEGAVRGDSADTIAADITALLSNPDRAQMIATTELSRAVSAAAVNGYQDRGYREIEWLTAEDDRVCPICFGNEEFGPVRIGAPFPSGALRPPGHPWCRCAAGVVISSREGANDA